MSALKYEGKTCGTCGTTTRYESNRKCVECMRVGGAARFAKRMKLKGNDDAGLPQGFVRFGTLAHRILLHIHHYGPAGHDDLQQDLQDIGISANLGRLHKHGFLFKVGRTHVASGIRSGNVFGLTRAHHNMHKIKMAAPGERQARYRAAQKLKVPSVFEFRGSVTL
jgi:hypothetical protein